MSLNLDLPDSLGYESLDSAYLDIICINNTYDTLKINSSQYWVYSQPIISMDKKIVLIKKINPVINCEGEIVTILPKNQKKVKYEYSIKQLTNNLKKGYTYKIKLTYRGLLSTEKNSQEILSIDYDEIKFKIL